MWMPFSVLYLLIDLQWLILWNEIGVRDGQ
jgi:hypothetical protein